MTKSFPACRHDRLRAIHLAVAALELSFQSHFEMGKIDKVPTREFPASIFLAPLMFKPDDEMHCILAHLVRRFFRFEIKCTEAAVAAANRIKFRVEIEDAFGCKINNP
jgi:hypothetical protein